MGKLMPVALLVGSGASGKAVRASLVRVPIGNFEKWSGNDGKVLDMMSEEVAEPHEGPDSFYVVRRGRLFDAFHLGLAWFDTFRG